MMTMCGLVKETNMRKQTWMDGLLDAERMHHLQGYTLDNLKHYLQDEASIVSDDYHWSGWCEGFGDYIKNLEFRGG